MKVPYQTLRYVHELRGEYAARVHSLRSYDAISRDILQRWAFPFVPDTNVLAAGPSDTLTAYSYARGQKYLHAGVLCPRTAVIGNQVRGRSLSKETKIDVFIVDQELQHQRSCCLGLFSICPLTVGHIAHDSQTLLCSPAS